MTHKPMRLIRKASVVILINVILAIILFIIIEGLSSSILVAKAAFFSDLIAERRHTQYDEELGWVNLPNLSIEDMYGGKSFKTNSMSFRNNNEFSVSVPGNKVRVICSGDSYTMGFGVGNDDVWCKLLESINNRMETVNLGQGGYGVDQAYLWYKRNSSKLEHNIQIFAFISTDFKRMQRDTFLGYGKPFLVLKDAVLINKNEPVPKRSYSNPRSTKILRELGQLKSVELLGRVLPQKAPSLELEDNSQAREIVLKIFKNLQEINRAENSTLVLVYLPTRSDYMDTRSEGWRHFIHSEAIKHGFRFIDLIDEFRKYPPQKVEALFALGHYSEKGNSYIANIMYEKLLAIPEVAYKLQEK